MLKIRLQRNGRRNQPHFRMVVAEHTVGPKSNKIVELLGSHNPRTKQTTLKKDRIEYWISVGAQPTDRVHNMLIKEKIINAKTINVLPQKSPVVKDVDEQSGNDTATEDTKEVKGEDEKKDDTSNDDVEKVTEESSE